MSELSTCFLLASVLVLLSPFFFVCFLFINWKVVVFICFKELFWNLRGEAEKNHDKLQNILLSGNLESGH
jgi:hypothetical protein